MRSKNPRARRSKSRRGPAAQKHASLAPLRRAHHALPEIVYRRVWP